MKDTLKYRLGDSTVVEPLIGHWPAWAQLISPVPSSLHLLNYQVEVLRSYLREPDAHIRANRDPELIGGPFADIPAERSEEVRALLESTQETQAHRLAFARAAVEFHNWLVDQASGQSLEPFYEFIPEPLRGYVELVYDYYHRPTVRFLEGLLYESPCYDKALQSLRLWQLRSDDSRPFFMSTPRLPDNEQLDWRIPFEDWRVDELFKLDSKPQPLGYIREILNLGPSADRHLLQLLSAEPVRVRETVGGESAHLRYFGHACVLVEYNGVSILTDPFVGAIPEDGGLDRFSFSDLPERIDYAVVTHSHQDHFAIETLLRLRHRIGCLIVPKSSGYIWGDVSLKLMAQKLGFKNVAEMDSLGQFDFDGGAIIGVPFFGEHGDLGHSKSAYVIRAGQEQILFAADSDCLDARIYENVRKSIGPIETVFLGMECVGAPLTWSCGPLFPRKPEHSQDQTRRQHGCNSTAGMEILEAVGARRFYNYAMGMEPWLEHILGLNLSMDSTQIRESNKLLAATRARGFRPAERLYAKRDICLGESGLEFQELVGTAPVEWGLDDVAAGAPGLESCAGVAFGVQHASDVEDEFIFD
jgi:L-ascorbate metabolism protein UlaG (beta-lactamase superfamily)